MARVRQLITVLLLLPLTALAATEVQNVRVWSENGRTRVVLDLSQPSEHSIFTLRGRRSRSAGSRAFAEFRRRAQRAVW